MTGTNLERKAMRSKKLKGRNLLCNMMQKASFSPDGIVSTP